MKFSYLVCEPVPDLNELVCRMRRLAELGYQGIELTASYPFPYPLDDLAQAADQIGLPVVSLLSGWSYAHEGLCLSSPSDEVRKRTVARLMDYVEMAHRLGALVVVGLLQGSRSDEPDGQIANRRIAEALGQVAQLAEARRVPIIIEPVNHLQVGFNHTAAEVAELVQAIDSPSVNLMLDTIHMNIEEHSPLDTIRRYGARIGHFHLCESNGGLFGGGNLDFAAILAGLRKAGYDKYVSIKIYRHPAWDVAARSAIEFLREFHAGLLDEG